MGLESPTIWQSKGSAVIYVVSHKSSSTLDSRELIIVAILICNSFEGNLD